MSRIIEAKEIRSKKTVDLARWLVGKQLVRRSGDWDPELRLRITETEAYDGERDLACHASKGRTPRSEVLYLPGGVWYVYLCYGIHEMLNLVAGPADWPAAVLIRGVEGISGPGRITRALNVDRGLNRAPAEPSTGLWLEDDGFVASPARITRTPRIGVDYAGPVWAAKPWRFVLTPYAESVNPIERAATRDRSKHSPAHRRHEGR
ncbi:MAG: DNA-3-methyladenine glycosylase [Opitutaceae bacterium]|nr:DNA-3-methyladenine glycosylase [Opitutaceae bacterium]